MIEAAKEYEESRATKRKYEEVDCMTGEENDVNVFQLNTCKLYMFNNAKSNWTEKGRGQLRVNDMDGGQSSRVVMRNNGNLKVILNTKVIIVLVNIVILSNFFIFVGMGWYESRKSWRKKCYVYCI